MQGALASLSLSMLLSSLGTSIANVGLPTFAETFNASLGDIAGRRRLLICGIVLFTVGSVLCAVAPTLGLLVAARAVQGLGAAIMMTLGMALVGETVPKAKTGRALGLLATMSALGTALPRA